MSFSFSQQHRITQAAEYQSFFKSAKKKVKQGFIIFYCKNDKEISRLGLVISKKYTTGAVQRNTFKRVIRESFRYHHQALAGLDVVVMARHGLKEISKTAFRQDLDKEWEYLKK